MPRIEPRVGSDFNPSNGLPPNLSSDTKCSFTKSKIRRSNQRKVLIASSSLFAIMVALAEIILLPRQSVNLNSVSYRLGSSIALFLMATVLALGFTLLSKKLWTWGFAVFLLLIFLIPIFLIGS